MTYDAGGTVDGGGGQKAGLLPSRGGKVARSGAIYQEISRCRLCASSHLEAACGLGEQCLTGVFPKATDPQPPRGPLTLVRCARCELVQLRHSYESTELYGPSYGYRSGLNRSMVEHLGAAVQSLRRHVELDKGDLVLDIGSSDGTLLSFFPRHTYRLVGFDPSAEKFRHYYREDMHLMTDFFSAERFFAEFGSSARARLVTSLAMFYDLEDPLDFMRQIESILADDGVWHFEQSYLPAMLASNAYDTICHEHLEYYAVKQIKWMIDRAGLKILDIALNDVNGGSFAITAAKRGSPREANDAVVDRLLRQERQLGLGKRATYAAFEERVHRHRERLVQTLHQLKNDGRLVLGYGASTKGNVILQFCNIDKTLIPCIAEVNEQKFGCVTPGSGVPIVSEPEAKALKPDCFLVLPWHFKQNLVEKESEYLRKGGMMLFPLPEIEEIRG